MNSLITQYLDLHVLTVMFAAVAAGATVLTLAMSFDVRHMKGLGLLGIQERVARLGGKSSVHSRPGEGAILSVELPLTEKSWSIEARETDSHPVS